MAGIGDVASAKLSDVTIKYGKFQLFAHKLVLVQHSAYFRAMFAGNFFETSSRTIEVRDDEPFAFQGLIAHCYGLQYDGVLTFTKYGLSANDAAAYSNNAYLRYQVDLYVAAEKYLVPTLCTQIKNEFPSMLRKFVESEGSLSVQVVGIIDHIYIRHENGAEDLRKPAIALLVEKAASWKGSEEFEALLLAVPQLALDMVTVMAKDAPAPLPAKRPCTGTAMGTRSKSRRS